MFFARGETAAAAFRLLLALAKAKEPQMLDMLAGAGAHWWAATTTDIARYVIFAVGVWFVLWVALSGVLAGRRIRAERPPARQMAVEFLISIRSVAIFSTVGLMTFFLEELGFLKGAALAASWGPIWFWASLVAMIIGHDAYFYWAHRAMHDPRLFRRFHRRHHKSHNPTPFTAYSFDLAEAAVMATFVPAWVMLVPTPWPVVGLFMLHQIVRNTLGHAGYELMPARRDGRPLVDWLTTTVHHDLHHAEAGWNYGLYFTWWDRWMGTEHPEYHARFARVVGADRRPQARSAPVLPALALAGALLAVPSSRAETPADITGAWATPGLGAVVRIAPCENAPQTRCGRLVWAWDPTKLKRIKVGDLMIEGLVWQDGRWTDGLLVNPEDGRIYRGHITSGFADGLDLKGCAGPICARQTWRRLESLPQPGA